MITGSGIILLLQETSKSKIPEHQGQDDRRSQATVRATPQPRTTGREDATGRTR